MKILACDDEKLVLDELLYHIRKAEPTAEITGVCSPTDALAEAEKNRFDILFTDIQMPQMNGVQLAKAVKKIHPRINVIFVTGFSEYKDDAIRLHCSGYINKPVSSEDIREELDNLIHPVENEAPHSRIYIKTFGNFSVFVDKKPVYFKRERELELLAYLVDRAGAVVSRKEVAGILFEDSDFSRSEQIYLSRIAHDLADDLENAGAGEIFIKHIGNYSIDTTKFECDSYNYLAGNTDAFNQFQGEYMEQYSWAEFMKGKFYT